MKGVKYRPRYHIKSKYYRLPYVVYYKVQRILDKIKENHAKNPH